MQTAVSPELQLAIERFLYYEAWLLDERRLHAWLGLFTEDAAYSVGVRATVQGMSPAPAPVSGQGMPSHSTVEGEANPIPPLGQPDVPLFDDDKHFLTVRVRRLQTRLAHAEQPPSLTRHLISNVLIHPRSTLDGQSKEGDIHVSSNFVVFQTRIDIADHLFYGKRDDLLRQVDGEWKIAGRRVVVDKSPLPNVISIFF